MHIYLTIFATKPQADSKVERKQQKIKKVRSKPVHTIGIERANGSARKTGKGK